MPASKGRAKYGGMDVPDAKWLRELEAENAELKRRWAEVHLELHPLGRPEHGVPQSSTLPRCCAGALLPVHP